MDLRCDICGKPLTETDHSHAVCDYCGMEYGPERLQELRGTSVGPTSETPVSDPVPTPVQESKPQQKSGCGIWFLVIMAVLDLVIGTHGIVAVFCLLIAWLVSKFSKK